MHTNTASRHDALVHLFSRLSPHWFPANGIVIMLEDLGDDPEIFELFYKIVSRSLLLDIDTY